MDEDSIQRQVIQSLPDLLNSTRAVPRNFGDLREMLQFAFSSGESGGALRRSLAMCDASLSDWQSDCFAEDLFVDQLITGCFRVTAERFSDDYQPPQNYAYLRKVLLHPPRSQDSILFRQQMLQELLDKPPLRVRFEAVYRRLTELREDLDSAGLLGCEYSTRRRIDLLLHIKQTVDMVAQEFADCSSGISRIRVWAQAFQSSQGYAALRDFVAYEKRLSSVQLQFQVGVDGSLRNLKIVGLADNAENPFYQSPLARLWAWVRLWWSGSKLGRDELVARVVEKVFDGIDLFLVPLLPLIGHMEFYLAALAFKERCESTGLRTCHPTFVPAESGRVMRGLFNPLLLDQERAPVTCDFDVERGDALTVITGPNSGGKTRLLQSLGLLQLLGQGGLFVPAQKAELWFRSGIFVSLIQSSSADQTEGRLGTELLRIRHLFEKTQREALIILDELCSGTNPSEGEEIVLLVLSLLKELGPEALITTHFLRFAEQLAKEHAELGLTFRQVELDPQQEPTYQFIPGVARTSLAGRTAKRLGVTREHLQSLIKKKDNSEPPEQARPATTEQNTTSAWPEPLQKSQPDGVRAEERQLSPGRTNRRRRSRTKSPAIRSARRSLR